MKELRDWVDVSFKVVLAAVGIVVGYYFSFQKQQNDDIKLIVDMATSEQSAKRMMGASIAQSYLNQRRIPQEVYVAVYSYANNSGDQALRAVVNTNAEATSKEQPGLGKALALANSSFPVRIYFHIRNESDRAAVEGVKKSVESSSTPDGKSIIVPAIELVPGDQTKSVLKCFKKAECQALGQTLSKLISSSGLLVELDDESSRYERSQSIRPNHFEAWFAHGVRE